MNDPKRLLTSDISERELRLLRAGAGEEPPADGATRLALALGLAPSSIGAFEPREASVPPPAASATHAAAALSTKWIALMGAGTIVIAGATALLWNARSTPPPESGHEASAPAHPAAALPLERASTSAPERASADGETPSIAAELAQLERVRVRISAGDGAGALSLLGAYQRAHAAGAKREEAAFMRVEALALSGRRSEARRAAKSFERLYPESVHNARVKAIAGSLDGR